MALAVFPVWHFVWALVMGLALLSLVWGASELIDGVLRQWGRTGNAKKEEDLIAGGYLAR